MNKPIDDIDKVLSKSFGAVAWRIPDYARDEITQAILSYLKVETDKARLDEQMRTEVDSGEIVVSVDFPYLLSGHMVQADRIEDLEQRIKKEEAI